MGLFVNFSLFVFSVRGTKGAGLSRLRGQHLALKVKKLKFLPGFVLQWGMSQSYSCLNEADIISADSLRKALSGKSSEECLALFNARVVNGLGKQTVDSCMHYLVMGNVGALEVALSSLNPNDRAAALLQENSDGDSPLFWALKTSFLQNRC